MLVASRNPNSIDCAVYMETIDKLSITVEASTDEVLIDILETLIGASSSPAQVIYEECSAVSSDSYTISNSARPIHREVITGIQNALDAIEETLEDDTTSTG